jgi:hypothetical protein
MAYNTAYYSSYAYPAALVAARARRAVSGKRQAEYFLKELRFFSCMFDLCQI